MKCGESTQAGLEFTNEPATDQQKDWIAVLAIRGGEPIDRHGVWPEPFTRQDAARMIQDLERAIEERPRDLASIAKTRSSVEEMARLADDPGLADRRGGVWRTPASGWRIWSDGEVTTDGRPPLCEELGGADDLALQFPHEADQGTYAWVTRRDALAIRDAIAQLLGTPQVVRRRALRAAGVARPEDRLPWPVLTDPPDVLAAVSRLSSFVRFSSPFTALAKAAEGLLFAREFGAQLPCLERDLLELYAGACGATYGDPAIGEAIDRLLSVIDREGDWLDQVSTTGESLGDGKVRVDLQAIAAACQEAIHSRPVDSSPPRVTISADVLGAVASYARALRETVLGGSIADLAVLAADGPMVSGPGAADACGSVVQSAALAQRAHPDPGGDRLAPIDAVRADRPTPTEDDPGTDLTDDQLVAIEQRCRVSLLELSSLIREIRRRRSPPPGSSRAAAARFSQGGHEFQVTESPGHLYHSVACLTCGVVIVACGAVTDGREQAEYHVREFAARSRATPPEAGR